jgi:hypothetical protein
MTLPLRSRNHTMFNIRRRIEIHKVLHAFAKRSMNSGSRIIYSMTKTDYNSNLSNTCRLHLKKKNNEFQLTPIYTIRYIYESLTTLFSNKFCNKYSGRRTNEATLKLQSLNNYTFLWQEIYNWICADRLDFIVFASVIQGRARFKPTACIINSHVNNVSFSYYSI